MSRPGPTLRDFPLSYPGGRISVVAVTLDPLIVLFDNFITGSECDQLVEVSKPLLVPSKVVDAITGDDQFHQDRSSKGVFFPLSSNSVIETIEDRISKTLNWPVECAEGLQVIRYEEGGEYKPHFDYFDPSDSGTTRLLEHGGQRVGTFIIYLSDSMEGGGTVFPELNYHIVPKRGNALFFSYFCPCPRSLHGGLPVIRGEKWIATKWLREKPFP